MNVTPFSIAERFIGLKEKAGDASNPLVLGMLRLDGEWPESDSVAWCSAFVNFVCWLLNLPRSKSLAARSWLKVGTPVDLKDARQGDIVILTRAGATRDPRVINAPGHVGFYSTADTRSVYVLGGNQGDAVSVAAFPLANIIGIRRLGE
jgi:uncharacterized protein (TIGR02594 family)